MSDNLDDIPQLNGAEREEKPALTETKPKPNAEAKPLSVLSSAFFSEQLEVEITPEPTEVAPEQTEVAPETNEIKIHLINSAPYFRFLMIGIGLLVIMRYRPKGILPEKIIKQ